MILRTNTLRSAWLLLLLPVWGAAQEIQPAPAFSAEQQSVPAEEGWFTHGGTLSKQRHSPLSQIDRSNVQGLKALWHVQPDSGLAPHHHNQAQPLVHDDVI